MNGRPDYYILNPDHSVTALEGDMSREEALLAWARNFESMDRQIALTEIAPGVRVSTVFLGLDHNFSRNGPPLVFETMVFDDYGGGDMYRHATWEEALAGHAHMVEQVKASIYAPGVAEELERLKKRP